MPKKSKSARKKPRRFATKILLILIILLSLSLVFLIVFEMNSDLFTISKAEPKTFSIQDQCSVFVGQLIHTLNNEGECVQQCITACDTENMNYDHVSFIQKTSECHQCSCTCK